MESPWCHDGDEWRGIYFDDQNLRRAFERVSSELELKKNDEYYKSFCVGIWEFRPITDHDIKAHGEKEERFCNHDMTRERQEIRRISPEELQCFKRRKREEWHYMIF